MSSERYLQRVTIVKARFTEDAEKSYRMVNGKLIASPIKKKLSKKDLFENEMRKMNAEWVPINKSILLTGIVVGVHQSREGILFAQVVVESASAGSDYAGNPDFAKQHVGKKISLPESYVLYSFEVDIEELLTHSNENVRQLARARYNRLFSPSSDSST